MLSTDTNSPAEFLQHFELCLLLYQMGLTFGPWEIFEFIQRCNFIEKNNVSKIGADYKIGLDLVVFANLWFRGGGIVCTSFHVIASVPLSTTVSLISSHLLHPADSENGYAICYLLPWQLEMSRISSIALISQRQFQKRARMFSKEIYQSWWLEGNIVRQFTSVG